MDALWKELLPTSIDVCGTEYAIRSDYREALDICAALSDPGMSDQEKAFSSLIVLFPAFMGYVSEDTGETIIMPCEHYDEAIKQCYWFINGGEYQEASPAPKLVDWAQDFKCIVAPINRVTGKEIRSVEYMHWWTFLSAYQEIGDCTFAQIVRIRDKKARGKSLDKSDSEWYRRNRALVDFKMQYTQQEDILLDAWLGKKNGNETL